MRAPVLMMLVALLAGTSQASVAPPRPNAVVRVGDWRLAVHQERFTGAVTCRLTRGHMEFRRQTLIVHLPTRVDTSAAVYRIDKGPPFWARQDQMRMARLGFALDNDNLDNPSGGLVRIPVERLVGARALAIEAVANKGPYQFKIDGLDAALARAGQMGCGAGGFD